MINLAFRVEKTPTIFTTPGDFLLQYKELPTTESGHSDTPDIRAEIWGSCFQGMYYKTY